MTPGREAVSRNRNLYNPTPETIPVVEKNRFYCTPIPPRRRPEKSLVWKDCRPSRSPPLETKGWGGSASPSSFLTHLPSLTPGPDLVVVLPTSSAPERRFAPRNADSRPVVRRLPRLDRSPSPVLAEPSTSQSLPTPLAHRHSRPPASSRCRASVPSPASAPRRSGRAVLSSPASLHPPVPVEGTRADSPPLDRANAPTTTREATVVTDVSTPADGTVLSRETPASVASDVSLSDSSEV